MKLDFYEHNLPGKLITFCGLDGCGKTTMIQRLAETVDSPLLTKQPTDEVRQSSVFRAFHDLSFAEASKIYDYRAMALMAAADRLQHVKEVILPALEKGKTVISDRYFYSCLTNLRARGFEQDEWVYEITRSLPKPDVAVFLDVPVEVAIERVRKREAERKRFIDTAFEERLRKEYLRTANACGGVVIDSIGDSDNTYISLVNHLREKICTS